MTLKWANLTLRFLLEVGAIAALAYWDFTTAGGAGGVVAGIVAPLVFIAAWWTFVAPKASRRLPDSARLALEVALFGVVAVALVAAGQPVVGVMFGVAAVGNTVLVRWLGEV